NFLNPQMLPRSREFPMKSLIANLAECISNRRKSRFATKRRPAYRPSIEHLEDRRVMSGFDILLGGGPSVINYIPSPSDVEFPGGEIGDLPVNPDPSFGGGPRGNSNA